MKRLLALLILLLSLLPAPAIAKSVILAAPASIPSVSMVDGACANTLVDDATDALVDWIDSEYARIRATDAASTIIYQLSANTCYRLDGSLIIADKHDITIQGAYTVTTQANDNSDLISTPLVILPNRNDSGNPYPKVVVTTVFMVRDPLLSDVPGCSAWSTATNCNSQRRHIWLQDSDNVTLRALRVEGNNLTWDDDNPNIASDDHNYGAYKSYWEFEHAFAVDSGSNLTFDYLQARGIYGDGFYATGNINGLTLTNFRVSYNGRQGVAFVQGRNIQAVNVQILNTRRSGFDLEPILGRTVSGVTIRNSYINGYHVAVASGGQGYVNNVTVQNNKVKGPGVPWILVSDTSSRQRRDWRVYDNQVLTGLGSPQAAMRFEYVTNVDVALNVVHVDPTRSRKALAFTGVTGQVIVVGNDFAGACAPYTGVVSGTVAVSGNITATDCP